MPLSVDPWQKGPRAPAVIHKNTIVKVVVFVVFVAAVAAGRRRRLRDVVRRLESKSSL